MSNSWKTRELEILQLMAQGLTNNQIASQLYLSEETIRWYNKKIFEKLGASNRTQAVKNAGEQNLLESQKSGVLSLSKQSGEINQIKKSSVKYVSNHGIHIAYQTIGEGDVDLLFIHGFLSNLEIAWENEEYKNFFDELGKFARVILFDKRGMGLSDRVQGAPSIENTIEDAICVLNATASKQTFVMGTSEGGAASLLLASMYPERVHGLILYASTPKLVKTNGEPDWAEDEKDFDDSVELIQKNWGGPWAIQNFAPSREKDEIFKAWWAKALRSSTSPAEASAVLKTVRDIDVRALLPHIRTRTLVIHKTYDKMLNIEAGRCLASHMPNAKFLELKGTDHFFFVDSSQIISAVKEFIKEKSEKISDSWIGIVLYAKSLHIKKYQSKIHSELKSFQAKGISFVNNEIIVSFDSPSKAIQCALKLKDLIQDESVHIVLHVGECNVEHSKPTFSVIKFARQIVKSVPQGKIIITQTLRDILAGSGVVFDLHQVYVDEKKHNKSAVYLLT